MTYLTTMGQLLTSVDAWAALVSLSALEIVLGIDNVIFISILVSRLDARQGRQARRVGMLLALIFRIVLLFALTLLLGLSEPVFTVWDRGFSWHDVILIGGGLFLIAKATHELHAQAEARLISRRTKDALQAAKARGKVLGGFRGTTITDDARKAGRAAAGAKAVARAQDLQPTIRELQAAGVITLAGIAKALTDRGIPTARGKADWTPVQVSRVLARAA